MTTPNAPSVPQSPPLPPILQEPGDSRYEMFALAPEGRGGWSIDPLRAREMEDRGCRLFTRQVTTTDWGEVTTRVEGTLTSSDPEPPVGTVVRDKSGELWRRHDEARRCWLPLEDDGSFLNGDPESWTRVAGNDGPVVVVPQPGGSS